MAITVGAVRLLWAGYPGLNPLLAQGVFVIDEVERYLDPAQADALLTILAHTFSETQWIATTRSSELLALRDTSECVVLRRGTEAALVQAFTGDGARIH
jgi:predicted ATP-dependent endonuclease of OLD family